MERIELSSGRCGEDFHNFQVCYRDDDPSIEVVAFTATQIPGMKTVFSARTCRVLVSLGIPIFPEEKLPRSCGPEGPAGGFSYSDLAHGGHASGFSVVILGADSSFGPDRTMLRARSRSSPYGPSGRDAARAGLLNALGNSSGASIRSVVNPDPMPYCDLNRMRVERFATRRTWTSTPARWKSGRSTNTCVKNGIIVYARRLWGDRLEAAQKRPRSFSGTEEQ